MRKRTSKHEKSSTGRKAQTAGRVQTKEEETSWLKKGVLTLFVILILGLLILKLPGLIQHFVHVYRLKVPFFIDLSQPADFSQNHTVNFYLTSEEGISFGVWHTVPESLWKEAQGKDLAWYQKRLGDGSPVFIYLHGNTGTRAAPHRVGVAKLLSALDYHVLVPEYRGFGDSTGEPTEAGLTSDAIFVYNWVKARSGKSLVVIWGHSLGTGISSNMAAKLIEKGVALDGIILEGAFSSTRQKIPGHIFSWYYWTFPGMGLFFPEPWANNKMVFPTEENLKKLESPIMFLHSEDDHVVPIEIAQQMHGVAAEAQSADRVKLVQFDGSLGYLHNGLYRDPQMPDILRNFVKSL